jgi:hypothetical protein
MRVVTVEEYAQYQFHQIFLELLEENKEEIDEDHGGNLAAWAHRNPARVGEAFLNRVDQYCGIDEAIENED